jgi:hypothetical protein
LQSGPESRSAISLQFPLSVIGVNETGRPQMATISKRRNGDGSTSWDAMVRIVGYPATGRSFRTKLAAELRAGHTEAARKGRTVASAKGMTLDQLIDDALPRLTNPTAAIFVYWREQLGDVRLDRITPEQIALHRDRLLGADCRGHNHKTSKPRSPATVRNYDLRHSCASALVQNGANLAEVATLLGHKGLAMTLRYSHVGNAGTTRMSIA